MTILTSYSVGEITRKPSKRPLISVKDEMNRGSWNVIQFLVLRIDIDLIEIFRRNCVWVCSTKTSFFCNENRKWSITFLVVYVQVVVNAPDEWWWRNIWRRDICLGSLLGKRDQSYVMWVCVRDRFEDLFTGRLKTQRQSKIVTFSKFGLNLRWRLK